MSDTIQAVFQEYTRLRLNGLDAPEAVRALHPYLEQFDADTRDELAQNMRAWENQRTENISLIDRDTLAKAAEIREAQETIKCPKCGRQNVAKDAICFSCGTLLNPAKASSTDILDQPRPTLDEALFTDEHTLYLIPFNDTEKLMLRPQLGTGRLTFGRDGSASDVDVDLAPYKASDQGVSRTHAFITYDEEQQHIWLTDMNSTNGTYINDYVVHPNEHRVLRHGDEVRFGRLDFRVEFRR